MYGVLLKSPVKGIPCTTIIDVSEEEVLLAKKLTDMAFQKGINIARDKNIEFLLFLEGKRQISSLKKADLYLALPVFSKLKIKGKRKILKKKASWEAIERISLSRI